METKKCPVWRRPEVARLLVVALLCELGVAVMNVGVMPRYLTDQRGFSTGMTGLIVAGFLLSEASFKVFTGHLADKHGRWIFLVLAPLIWSLSPILTVLVPNDWQAAEQFAMFALRILDGVCAAMLWPAAYAAVAEAVQEKEKANALSLLNTCFMVGLALGFPVTGFVNKSFEDLGAGLFVASGLFLAAAAVSFFAVTRDGKHAKSGATYASDHSIRDLWNCVKDVPLIFAVAFIAFFGVGAPMVPIQKFALEEYCLDQRGFGLLVFPAALLMAVCSGVLGRLGERVGCAKAVRIGLAMCAAGTWLITAGGNIPALRNVLVLGLGAGIVGLGFLLTIPAWYTTVSRLNPQKSGSYMGAVMTVQGIGAIFGLAVGSRSYQYGHYYPFALCAVSVSIAFLMSLMALPKTKDELKTETQP